MKACMFYLTDDNVNYSFKKVNSGYRCINNNVQKGRTSVNHMGMALDFHFNYKTSGNRARNQVDIERIREQVFVGMMGAQFAWTDPNKISLELSRQGATSWVHIDVREYEDKYKDTRFFAKTVGDMIGGDLSTYADNKIRACGGDFINRSELNIVPIEELRVRAFMRMLRVGEGTVGDKGYETLFGGRSFIEYYKKDFSDHPRISRPFGNSSSTAAGAYQVMGYTWDDPTMISRRREYGIQSFSKRDQDLFCVILLKYKRPNAWPLLLAGEIEESLKLNGQGTNKGYAYEWASLPPGRYGQPSKTMSEALSVFNRYFEEESNRETDLVIEYGFLKEIFHE